MNSQNPLRNRSVANSGGRKENSSYINVAPTNRWLGDRRTGLVSLLSAMLMMALNAHAAYAGSATWALDPGGIDHWDDPNSWLPMTVPDGRHDVATFSVSNSPFPILFSNVEVSRLVFQPEASAFTVHFSGATYMIISGAGIVNDSSVTQSLDLFVITGGPGSTVQFINHASAGVATEFTLRGGMSGGAASRVNFLDDSSAGHATLSNQAATDSTSAGAFTFFGDNSRAGEAAFSNEGGTLKRADGGTTQFAQNASAERGAFVSEGGSRPLAGGGLTQFLEHSTAAKATLTANAAAVGGEAGPGTIQFLDDSSAANASLIGHGGSEGSAGGSIQFAGKSAGGAAKIEVFGNGNLDLSEHELPGLSIGSLQGDGMVFLGANNLVIGNDSSSITFAGVITDGGAAGGSGGSISKAGEGALTLTGANLYTGGTNIDKGTLVVTNISGSGTGSGPVQVNSGTLGGDGIVSGGVTVGTGSGLGAFLAPAHGTNEPTTFTTEDALFFKRDGAYNCSLKARRSKGRSDQILAKGVTIESGASFNLSARGPGELRRGLTFRVIDNTASTPIAGAFSNLADGAILVVNGNKLLADYEGDDGNDLTLTVVP